jgi:hypothetical protein
VTRLRQLRRNAALASVYKALDRLERSGSKNAELHNDVAILMPEGVPYVLKSTSDEDLTMYVLDEPIPAGFHPIPQMLVSDERQVPIRKPAVDSPFTAPEHRATGLMW